MFPNPQEAIPLLQDARVERYRALADDLVSACGASSIGAWAGRWIDELERGFARAGRTRVRQDMDHAAFQVAEFAARHLGGDCTAAKAQFVIAQSHGFTTWPGFIQHIERLSGPSEVATFETAADAIVDGDEATLRRLLGADPGMVQATSEREHGATLLIYTSANGVEGYRQLTPPNIVRMAGALLDAGADVEATAHVYGGECSTLGLVATSAHPRSAGVQIPLMELLLARGARMQDGIGGHAQGAVFACLGNGCPEAAQWMADHGARVGLIEAAALGRLTDVTSAVRDDALPQARVNEAFRFACSYGQTAIAELLLAHGADLADGGPDSQTGAHCAVIGGRLATLRMLLGHRPPLEAKNVYGGTVLGQTLWSAAHGGNPVTYIQIIQALLDAGAALDERHVPVSAEVDAFLATKGSAPEPTWYWFGEGPRRR